MCAARPAPDVYNFTASRPVSHESQTSILAPVCVSWYEVKMWLDPRLMYDTSSEALCVIGQGGGGNTWFALEPNDVQGDNKIIWTPDVYIINQREIQRGQVATMIYDNGLVAQVREVPCLIPGLCRDLYIPN